MWSADIRNYAETRRTKNSDIFTWHESITKETKMIMERYEYPQEVCNRELEDIIAYWHGKLSHFQVKNTKPWKLIL